MTARVIAVAALVAVLLVGGRARAEDDIAVVDTRGANVDAALVSLVTGRVRDAVEDLGYAAADPALVRRVVAPFGPRDLGPPDLLFVARQVGTERSIHAKVSVGPGGYDVFVFVASSDGRGPWSARELASADGLPGAVDRAVGRALPPPGEGAPRAPEPEQNDAAGDFSPFRLAIHTNASLGVVHGFFYNHVGGLRFDHWFSRSVAFGFELDYANLEGRNGRAHNVLPGLQLEYRPRPFKNDRIGIPLRYYTGFLPNNGPVVRLSAGIAVDVSDDVDLVFDLLAPSFWLSDRLTVMALDVGFEVGVKL